jgi:hypothetical protein
VINSPSSFIKDVAITLLDFYRIKDMPEPTSVKLSDVLKHPKLYEAYPELKDIPVEFYSAESRHKGHYNPQTGSIRINKNISKEKQFETILHEIQHAIQNKEGWSGGSYPDAYKLAVSKTLSPEEYNLLNSGKPGEAKVWEKLEQETFKLYQRNQGEASARAAAARRNLDDQQISSDKTIKCAFSVGDGKVVEGVLIPTATRTTACISTQVGCSLSCAFCATGRLKLMRNLTPGEIVDQVVYFDLVLDAFVERLEQIVGQLV